MQPLQSRQDRSTIQILITTHLSGKTHSLSCCRKAKSLEKQPALCYYFSLVSRCSLGDQLWKMFFSCRAVLAKILGLLHLESEQSINLSQCFHYTVTYWLLQQLQAPSLPSIPLDASPSFRASSAHLNFNTAIWNSPEPVNNSMQFSFFNCVRRCCSMTGMRWLQWKYSSVTATCKQQEGGCALQKTASPSMSSWCMKRNISTVLKVGSWMGMLPLEYSCISWKKSFLSSAYLFVLMIVFPLTCVSSSSQLYFTFRSQSFIFFSQSARVSTLMIFALGLLPWEIGRVVKWKSLRYLPLYPPKQSKELPMTREACLLRGLGSVPFGLKGYRVLLLGQQMRMSLVSYLGLILPAKIKILPSQTSLECPHRSNPLQLLINFYQRKLLVAPQVRSELRSTLWISPWRWQSSLHPPIIQKWLPIKALLWNLRFPGPSQLFTNSNLRHELASRLKTQQSSRSILETPSPPQLIKQGQWNSEQWQVRSQGASSAGFGSTLRHCMVERSRSQTVLKRSLLRAPPPKRTTWLLPASWWMVQLDRFQGSSPVVSTRRHSAFPRSKSQRSSRQRPSAVSPPKPPKSSAWEGEMRTMRWPQRSSGSSVFVWEQVTSFQ